MTASSADKRRGSRRPRGAQAKGVLADFDIPPLQAYLQVTCFALRGSVGEEKRYETQFEVAFDMGPFLQPAEEDSLEGLYATSSTYVSGTATSEKDKLKSVSEFVRSRNELEALVLQKQVFWPAFEGQNPCAMS